MEHATRLRIHTEISPHLCLPGSAEALQGWLGLAVELIPADLNYSTLCASACQVLFSPCSFSTAL